MPNGQQQPKKAPLPRPVPPKWDPNAAKAAAPASAAQTQKPQEPIEAELEGILIKDETGQFRVLSKEEFAAPGKEMSRKLIDRIQKEIQDALKKTPAAMPGRPVPELFDVEEEAKDVRQVAGPPLAGVQLSADQLAQMAGEIIKEAGITIKDEVLLNRLKNIIINQLRGVRKMVDTRMILIRTPQQGGVGFDGTNADKVIAAISKRLASQEIKIKKRKEEEAEKVKDEFTKVKRTLAEAPTALPAVPSAAGLARPSAVPAVPAELSVSAPAAPARPSAGAPFGPAPAPLFERPGAKPTVSPSVRPGQPVVRPTAKPPAVQITPAPTTPSTAPQVQGKPLAPTAPPAAPPIPEKPTIEIPIKDFTPQVTARPAAPEKITDIKPPAQLVGPVQELNYTLTDFRRLSDSPFKAIEKIQEKIKNLEAESFGQRIQGIKAWQISEVFRVYVAMGLEAMKTQQSLENVIKSRQTQNQPVLTKEEFDAVNELNQRLQF